MAQITQYLPIIIASGLLAFLVTPLTRVLAQRWGMIDQPGLRKAHRSPVPLLGGLAIYAAFALAFLVFAERDWRLEGLSILGGATVLFLTGLWDDRFGMPARMKLLAQAIAALNVIGLGVQVRLFNVWWLDWPITLIWIVGITNAVNLMDNMDGLAAGVSAVAAIFFFLMAALEGQGFVAGLAAAVHGAALGFLFYNFAPAMSFMGDSGSLTLGFMLAVLGIKIKFAQFPIESTWMAPIVVLGVLIFDTTLVMVSRRRRGLSIFQGGSDHTSHRIAQLGLSPSRVALTLYVAAASLGALAIFLTRTPGFIANLTFGLLVLAGLVALAVFERIEPKLSGDPPLVIIPAGEGIDRFLPDLLRVSRNLTILFAPRRFGGEVRPTRAEVIEIITALAEEPASTRGLLLRGLSEEWWRELNHLNAVLRLTGAVAVVHETVIEDLPAADGVLPGVAQAQVITTLQKAKLILLGPGEPGVNLMPVLASPDIRATLAKTKRPVLSLGPTPLTEQSASWLGHAPQLTTAAALTNDLQMLLLSQAAGVAKTAR